MNKSRGATVVQAAGLLMASTILSRVLGYVRDIIISSAYGQGQMTDAYLAAFSIPDFLYSLLVGGAISAAFIPVFSSYIATDREDEGWKVASTIFNIVVPVFLLGIVIAAVLAPYIVENLLVPGFEPEYIDLTVTMTRIMLAQAFFMALNGICMGILNSHQRFFSTSLASVMYNVMIIVCGLLLRKRFGIIGFSVGVVVGAATQFLIQFAAVRRIGLRYEPGIDPRHPGVRRIFFLMVPVVLSFTMNQLGLFVQQNLSSSMAYGSLTAVRWSQRLMQLPIGIFATTIAMAIFPTLTGQVARREMDLFKSSFSLGLRTIFYITIPSAVGLAVLSEPVVRLLYQQGSFSSGNTALTAYTLSYFCLGLCAYSGVQLMNRMFYALQNTWTPVVTGAATMGLNIALNYVLVDRFGTGGLALSYSLAGIVNLLLLLWLLRRKIGRMDLSRVISSFLKTLGVSLIMGGGALSVSWALESFVVDVTTKAGQLTQVIGAVGTGALLYVALSLALGMEEIDFVRKVLGRRFKRK